jgi:hypothetical protein
MNDIGVKNDGIYDGIICALVFLKYNVYGVLGSFLDGRRLHQVVVITR